MEGSSSGKNLARFALELALINHNLMNFKEGNRYNYFKRKHPVVGIEVINSDIASMYDAILSARLGVQFYKGSFFGGNAENLNSQN